MDNLEVIRTGSGVHLRVPGKVGIEGIVTAACIRGQNISYDVAWWDGSQNKSAWFAECELEPEPYDRLPVGFRMA